MIDLGFDISFLKDVEYDQLLLLLIYVKFE